jgi:hypothetical protein
MRKGIRGNENEIPIQIEEVRRIAAWDENHGKLRMKIRFPRNASL